MDEEQKKLVEETRPLVEKIARQYANRGLSVDELVAVGMVGVTQALEKYEPERGYKFSTYSTWWIRDAITKALEGKPPTPKPSTDGDDDDRL